MDTHGRTIKLYGFDLTLGYSYEHCRFPQRRHTFYSPLPDGTEHSESGSTPRNAWRNFDTSLKQAAWRRDHLQQAIADLRARAIPATTKGKAG